MGTALVTAIGSFSADIVIKRLRAAGEKVVGSDIYARELVADALSVDAFYQAPYTSDRERYASFVASVCEAEGVDRILPLTDVDVDFFNAARAADGTFAGALVCIPPASALAYCRDKQAMARFLEGSASGVRGIETRPLASFEGVPAELPVVVKPRDGRSSQGLRYVHDEQEWAELASIPDPGRYVVQPLVEGRVVCVDVVRSATGDVCVAVPRREYLRTLNGAGTSVEVFHDAALEAASRALAGELGVVGCVNFEFIEEGAASGVPEPGTPSARFSAADVREAATGAARAAATGAPASPASFSPEAAGAEGEPSRYRFLECNPRFSGGVEFTCIAAYDCVTNHLRAFRGEPLEPLGDWRAQFIARKYEEYVTRLED
jgi:carbamoyl-phosphate synthase large subunit